MGMTLQTSPANMVIGARPTKIPCVLFPFWRFWPAASAQVKTPTGMLSGMAWMTSLWSFRAFANDTRRLVFTIVSTVLLETSDSKRPTSADTCGAVCWAYQLSAPSVARSCPFSRSVVGSLFCFFRVAFRKISGIYSIFVSETGEKNHLAVPPQELHTK